MGTHAILGVRLPDDSITGCYVHYDGDSMRGRIEKFLHEKTTTCLTMLITQAQGRGGMRSFHCPVEWLSTGSARSSATEFLDDNELYVIDETNFHEDHYGARHWYLVDYETQEIMKRSR